ncbi:Membrane insertase YidC/Oxa1 C-terminal [Trinorchestia longiramus]|nr:Membrane insertase YidC/Oxa1 C-terminal [Trinorchestia longiramus]
MRPVFCIGSLLVQKDCVRVRNPAMNTSYFSFHAVSSHLSINGPNNSGNQQFSKFNRQLFGGSSQLLLTNGSLILQNRHNSSYLNGILKGWSVSAASPPAPGDAPAAVPLSPAQSDKSLNAFSTPLPVNESSLAESVATPMNDLLKSSDLTQLSSDILYQSLSQSYVDKNEPLIKTSERALPSAALNSSIQVSEVPHTSDQSFSASSIDQPHTSDQSFSASSIDQPHTSDQSFSASSIDQPHTSDQSFSASSIDQPHTSDQSFSAPSIDQPHTSDQSFSASSIDQPHTSDQSFSAPSIDQPHTSAQSFSASSVDQPHTQNVPSSDVFSEASSSCDGSDSNLSSSASTPFGLPSTHSSMQNPPSTPTTMTSPDMPSSLPSSSFNPSLPTSTSPTSDSSSSSVTSTNFELPHLSASTIRDEHFASEPPLTSNLPPATQHLPSLDTTSSSHDFSSTQSSAIPDLQVSSMPIMNPPASLNPSLSRPPTTDSVSSDTSSSIPELQPSVASPNYSPPEFPSAVTTFPDSTTHSSNAAVNSTPEPINVPAASDGLEYIPVPPPPVEAVVDPVTLNCLGEATLASVGLAGMSPVGLMQQLIEFIHVSGGLPWWGAIAAVTVAMRVLLFPVIVVAQRNAAKLTNVTPQMQVLQMKVTEAREAGDELQVSRYTHELMTFMKEKNVNPLKNMIVPLAQAPIFISMFVGLRRCAALPVASFTTGGILWFTDLTIADPYYALPILTSITMYLTIQVCTSPSRCVPRHPGVYLTIQVCTSPSRCVPHHPGVYLTIQLGTEVGRLSSLGDNAKIMMTVMRLLPVFFLPFMINFPSAVLCYWLSSNLVSLGQAGLLRIPAFRDFCNIPQIVVHHPDTLPSSKKPKKSTIDSVKDCQAGLLRIPAFRDFCNIPQIVVHHPDTLPSSKKPKKSTIDSVKDSWRNMKVANQVQDRLRYDEVRFTKAGTGPVVRTFKYDPTKGAKKTGSPALKVKATVKHALCQTLPQIFPTGTDLPTCVTHFLPSTSKVNTSTTTQLTINSRAKEAEISHPVCGQDGAQTIHALTSSTSATTRHALQLFTSQRTTGKIGVERGSNCVSQNQAPSRCTHALHAEEVTLASLSRPSKPIPI